MKRYRWTPAALIFASAVLAGQAPPPATPPQENAGVTFKVEINYVEVDARVVNAQGIFVRDLKRDDFQVIEDGKPQAVTTFTLVDIPIEKTQAPLFARTPIEPDVATNAREFDGRLYMFVLDQLHTASLNSQLVKNAAKRFIETKLGANDRAAVVTLRGTTDANQGFTDNRRLLLQAVDHFIGQKLRSETLLRIENPDLVTGAPSATDPANLERLINADASLRTLEDAAHFLGGFRGRHKALIFISEGIEYDIYDFNKSLSSRLVGAAQEAIEAATRNNVSVYAIDPRGLTTGDDEAIDLTSQPSNSVTGTRSMQQERQLANDSLRVLADGTGGFAAVNTNDLGGVFDRIVADNSSYYLLGYYPANPRREGKTRRIEVKVRRPGIQVLTRKSYVEPKGRAAPPASVQVATGTSAALVEALNGQLPVTGLTLAATAAAFKGSAPHASVSIVINARGHDLDLKAQDGKYVGNLELSVWALDKSGKFSAGERPTVGFALSPETFAQVSQFGVCVLARLNLEPGRYQLRVGALRNETGARGSVFYDLEVPDFSKDSLTMSGLLLTSMAGSRAVNVHPDPELTNLLPAAPTTLREFPAGDALALFTEVYDNQVTPSHTVDLTTSVLTDEGRVVYTDTESRSSSELEGKPGGYGYKAQVSLKDLAPGLYVLKVEARSRLGQNHPIMRQIQFRIVS